MAINTNPDLRDLTFYQVFVRQYSKTHDFIGVINELDKIKSLGVDVIQLLPIHPIGDVNRKGTYGSPYSIKDYYEINKDLGTLDDFKALLEEAHKRGLRVVIDIVFNHTSHQSSYAISHPEWFYHKEDGSFCNRVGDWWDIIDFNFDKNLALENELTNVLVYYAKLGVDGYRCDVAPLLPLDFWKKAKEEVLKVNPNILFISESVHLSFVKYLRDIGYEACSDSEMYQVFDILYDYDIYDDLINYFKKVSPLSTWSYLLYRQDATYPKNYIKLRYLENHDFEPIVSLLKNASQLRSATCMLFFEKGIQFIHNGEETSQLKRPDLFEIDEINWNNYNKDHLVEIIQTMTKLKKELHYMSWVFDVKTLSNNVIHFSYKKDNMCLNGIFNLGEEEEYIDLEQDVTNILTNDLINKGKYKLVEPLVYLTK